MADTKGLLETRVKWLAAVEAGDTTMSHKDWYEATVKAKDAPKPDMGIINSRMNPDKQT